MNKDVAIDLFIDNVCDVHMPYVEIRGGLSRGVTSRLKSWKTQASIANKGTCHSYIQAL